MMASGLILKASFLVLYQKRKVLFQTTAGVNIIYQCGIAPKLALCESRMVQGVTPDSTAVQKLLKSEVHLFLSRCFKTSLAVLSSLCSVCLVLCRLTKLIFIFSPVLVLYPFSLINPRIHNIWWKYFLFSLEISGPVFIKLSQWASTRRDIFSCSTCSYLSSFQRDTSPHSWTSTCYVMEQTFGPGWEEMFVEFNKKPVGSGCVAQVYHACLKCNAIRTKQEKIYADPPFWKFWSKGKSKNILDSSQSIPVAVKVLHPYIRKEFEQNIGILHFCAKTVEFLLPSLRWLSLVDCVKEFEKFMLSQVDLLHEAQMLEVFHKNFKTVENVHFPKPIWPFISSEILIETWEEGVPISHFLGNDHPHFLKKKLAEIGVNVLLKMVFDDNFVHSDLHPGNILVQNADQEPVLCSEKSNPPLNSKELSVFPAFNPSVPIAFVILDCGLVSSLPYADFANFLGVFQAVALGKGEAVGELFLSHSVNECKNSEKFKNEMSRIISNARKSTLTLGAVDVGKLLGSVFTLLTTHKIKLESNFVSLMLAIMVLEGLGRSLDPTIDMIEKAKPYLFNNIFPF